MHREDKHFIIPEKAEPVLDDVRTSSATISGTYHTIKEAPTQNELFTQAIRLETRCRKEGMRPYALMLGSDMYLLFTAELSRYLMVDKLGSRALDSSFRGMLLLCDPALAPMAMRLLPLPEEACWRQGTVAEINRAES